MEPENTTPPEPNKPFGPAAESSQPDKPATATPESPVSGTSQGPATPPAPGAGSFGGPAAPAAGSAAEAPGSQPPVGGQSLPPQSGQPTDSAVQPVAPGVDQPPAVPTPVSSKAPRNTSLPAILLAGVVIVFLVALAVYAFTKM